MSCPDSKIYDYFNIMADWLRPAFISFKNLWVKHAPKSLSLSFWYTSKKY